MIAIARPWIAFGRLGPVLEEGHGKGEEKRSSWRAIPSRLCAFRHFPPRTVVFRARDMGYGVWVAHRARPRVPATLALPSSAAVARAAFFARHGCYC
jgi:hypothetical protein